MTTARNNRRKMRSRPKSLVYVGRYLYAKTAAAVRAARKEGKAS